MDHKKGLTKETKLLIVAGLLFLLYLTIVKIVAAHRLSYIADEPDDFTNILSDVAKAPLFFVGALSPDQGRLSHLLTLPALLAGKTGALFVGRLISIFAYSFFLVAVYKLLRLRLSSLQSFFGMVITGSSSYLMSFSVFAMTTSNNFFMLFGTLALYYYLKHFNGNQKSGIFQAGVLGVYLGLTTSAKLFGVIILLTVLLYDAVLHHRDKRDYHKSDFRSYINSDLGKLNSLFVAVWLLINIWPTYPGLKLVIMIAVSLGYLGYLWLCLSDQKNATARNGFIFRWLLIIHTAFIITIISSPIYFNIRNVLGIFNWFHAWNSTSFIVHASRFDFFTLVGVKFGLIAGVYVVTALALLIKRRQLGRLWQDFSLLWLVFLVFALIFIRATFFVAWYPLFIFWFLYLPLCYVMPEHIRWTKPTTVLLAILLFALPVYENVRYLRLFPYGQTDGAQLGSQYVGWNRPGFITFEGIPLIATYLESGAVPAGHMACLLVQNQRYNGYAVQVINAYLVQHNVTNLSCVKTTKYTTSSTVLTSVYSDPTELKGITTHYHAQKTIVVNTVPVVTVWRKN